VRAFNLPFAVLFAVLTCSSALAVARELYVVGTTFTGIFEQSAEGEYVGLAPELLREFAKRTGHTVRFDIYPWVRSQNMVAAGHADILIGPYKTQEREEVFNFSERPFFQDRILFYSRANAPLQWNGDYSSLHNKRIATIHGWSYGPLFDRARPTLNLYTTNTLQTGLRMLVANRIDLLASDERDTNGAILAMRLNGSVRPLDKSIDIRDGYFAFSKLADTDAIRHQLNEVLQQMVTSGELTRMTRKYQVRSD
jgi:polar amino acid transport system substrate-binding protein